MNSRFYDNKIFADNLKRLLEKKDMTASELARRIGVSKSAVSDWTKGVSLPRIDKVDKMCEILNCTRTDFTEPSIPSPVAQAPEIGGAVQITGFIPVYGEIPAGESALIEENIIDYITTSHSHPEEYFGLKVKGNSMINAGITDGAYVTIHKQNCAENGNIVACRVNGEEATLKRFRQQGNTVILMPENPEYEPIIVSVSDFESGYAQILGVALEVTAKL